MKLYISISKYEHEEYKPMDSTCDSVVDPQATGKNVNDDSQISLNSAYMRANNAYMLSKTCMVTKRTHIILTAR
jgi:hypothetical protein